MRFLNNIKIGRKIGGGFGIVLLLLLALAASGAYGLVTVGGLFKEYRGLARQSNEVARVQANLLSARVNAVKFFDDGSQESAERVKERGASAIELADNVLAMINREDKQKIIRDIKEQFQSYLANFDKVVALQRDRDDQVAKLDEIGPQAEKDLTTIMRAAASSGFADAAVTAGEALRSLMLTRLYANKYLRDSTEENYQRVQAELADLRRLVMALKKARWPRSTAISSAASSATPGSTDSPSRRPMMR